MVTAGAETNDITLEGYTVGFGTATISTTTVRTGTYAFKADAGAGNAAASFSWALGAVLDTTYTARVYVNVPALPAASVPVLWFRNASAVGYVAALGTDGTLGLFDGLALGTQIGSWSTFVVPLNTWVRIELSTKIGTGAVDVAELRVEGAIVASTTTGNLTDTSPSSVRIGWGVAGAGANAVIYLDDFCANDSTGSSQVTFPGGGRIVLLKPISDNARATLWTGGVGGTTNLWDAVDNTPPVGTATETNTTQIEHAGGAAGTTDAYDANMTTPATAGIRSTDVVNTAHFMEADGEDINPGSKLLNFEVLSNPVIASPGNVTAGNDGGALGTYPTTWVARASSPVYNPRLDVNVSPVMRARRPETASRVASVCFMGIYVDYTPGAMLPKQFSPVPFIPRGRNL